MPVSEVMMPQPAAAAEQAVYPCFVVMTCRPSPAAASHSSGAVARETRKKSPTRLAHSGTSAGYTLPASADKAKLKPRAVAYPVYFFFGKRTVVVAERVKCAAERMDQQVGVRGDGRTEPRIDGKSYHLRTLRRCCVYDGLRRSAADGKKHFLSFLRTASVLRLICG